MRHDVVGGACLETTVGGNPSNPHAWSTCQPHPFAARSIPVCTRERRHHLGATAEIEPGGPLKFVHDLEGMPRRFARLSIAQRYSAGPLAYSPTVPSIASRRKSAWPAWRAVSPIRCSSTQRREKRVPSRSGWTDRSRGARVGYDASAAVARFPVPLPEVLRPQVGGSAELPVGVGVPVHAAP